MPYVSLVRRLELALSPSQNIYTDSCGQTVAKTP